MNVIVKLNDGGTIYPTFAPEHRVEVIGYYTLQYWQRAIKGFRATLEDGTIIELGA
jgi:hypothetical protein